RILQQVLQHHAHQAWIRLDLQPGSDDELRASLGVALLEVRGDAAGEGAQVYAGYVHLVSGDAGQVEQVIDQRGHALARGAHAREVVLAGNVQPLGVVFQQRLTEAVDAAQRRPQVVGDRVGKRIQLGVATSSCAVWRRSVSSTRLRSVMSRMIAVKATSGPCRQLASDSSSGNSVPSFFLPASSTVLPTTRASPVAR